MFLDKLFWKIPHSIMFNKIMKKKTDNRIEMYIYKDRMGSYKYIIRLKLDFANILSYYEFCNIISNRYYGKIW